MIDVVSVKHQSKFLTMKPITLVLVILAYILVVQKVVAQDTNKRYELTSQPKIITSETGNKLQVESGMFTVPESRTEDKGRTISIAYYRITSKSKAPSSPIFILAGGPGSSYLDGLHNEKSFNEARFLSNFSDVIIFDQRGAGNSVPNLTCEGRSIIPLQEELTEEKLESVLITSANTCQDYWKNQDVNLFAYNTDESAADLNDLREAFGYDKIILSGGSYGSHLGLHTIRKFPDKIARAIFYGIEGPDHTWDVPSYTLNTLKRIAKTIEASSYYKDKLPKEGLLFALEEVLSRVEKEPKLVTLTRGDQTLEVAVNKMIVQKVAKYRAGRRSDPLQWPNLILDMYNGDFTFPAKASAGMHRVPAPNAMKYAMDFASGISDKRDQLIKNDNALNVLGDINFGYTMQKEVWKVNDLGPVFRENIVTDVPILLIHGNWDTSTPIENAYDILPSLKNGHLIEVERGTHNVLHECYRLVEGFPELIVKFITGEKVDFPNNIELPQIEYPEPISKAQENLWDACKSGDIEAAKTAITNGADVNALDTRGSKSGRKPLNWAAYYNHLEILKLLVEHNADINGQNITGFSPLHHAVESDNEQAVKLLLELGANQNSKNKRGKTPLDMAIANNQKNIISILK